jgi:DNA gyrase subunit A
MISMLIPEKAAQILTASERGFGKRTPLSARVAAVAARA